MDPRISHSSLHTQTPPLAYARGSVKNTLALATQSKIHWPIIKTLAAEKIMFDNKILEDLAEKMSKMLPPGLSDLQKEMQKSFHTMLVETLKRLDLVTREEFDIQAEVLLRTREKIDSLEKTIAKLEQKIKKEHTGHKSHKED
jgi:BMFP domain-containing protein YqiC